MSQSTFENLTGKIINCLRVIGKTGRYEQNLPVWEVECSVCKCKQNFRHRELRFETAKCQNTAGHRPKEAAGTNSTPVVTATASEQTQSARQTGQWEQYLREVKQEFIRGNPWFPPTEHNLQLLDKYMTEHKLDVTTENYRLAASRLLAEGKLKY